MGWGGGGGRSAGPGTHCGSPWGAGGLGWQPPAGPGPAAADTGARPAAAPPRWVLAEGRLAAGPPTEGHSLGQRGRSRVTLVGGSEWEPRYCEHCVCAYVRGVCAGVYLCVSVSMHTTGSVRGGRAQRRGAALAEPPRPVLTSEQRALGGVTACVSLCRLCHQRERAVSELWMQGGGPSRTARSVCLSARTRGGPGGWEAPAGLCAERPGPGQGCRGRRVCGELQRGRERLRRPSQLWGCGGLRGWARTRLRALSPAPA